MSGSWTAGVPPASAKSRHDGGAPILRIGSPAAVLAALAFWIVRIAVLTDFADGPALAGGALWCAAVFAATWRPKRRVLRSLAVAAIAAAMIVVGVRAARAAPAQQEQRAAVTRQVMNAVADAVRLHRARTGMLPEGGWKEMSVELEAAGAWRGLTVNRARGDKAARFDHIPPKDEWGCQFVYARTGADKFVLKSSGPARRWDAPGNIVITQ